MCRLIHADFIRLRKSKLFWGEIIGFALYIILAYVTSYCHMAAYGVDGYLWIFVPIFGIATAVFCSIFIGTEYSDGTIRNKLVVGKSRTAIYLANTITISAAIAAMVLITEAIAFAVGVPLFGMLEMTVGDYLIVLFDTIMMSIAFGAVYTLISTLNSSKAYAAIINILLAFALLMLAAWIYNKLAQPEIIQSLVGGDNGAYTTVEAKNPNFVTGMKRNILEILFDVIPSGQSMQIANSSLVHPYYMWAYSLLITVASAVAGIFAFNRKDIN